MAKKIVIYGRQNGEACIPLTIRIDWLADGAIKPLSYRTADGICFRVISLLESVPLAFLKEGGEGLRCKVAADITERPDTDGGAVCVGHEMYLYLADRRFSEKNIIDGRYGHQGKEYVPVTLDVFPDGSYELLYFTARGARYKVERMCGAEPRGSFQAGGVGVRHKVEARLVNANDDEDPDPQRSATRLGAVYWELNKWFVSVAKPDAAESSSHE